MPLLFKIFELPKLNPHRSAIFDVFDQNYNVAGRFGETMFNPAGVYSSETNVRGLLPGAPRAAWIGFRYEFGGAPEAN